MEFINEFNKAFKFASLKHKNQLRKGTQIPYVAHLYEVMQLLREEGASEICVIAGILHDTVEDTDTTLEEIKEIFGSEVADYVAFESEDKSLPYLERKTLHMQKLRTANNNVKLVNCADKISNLKSIYLDLKYFGNDVWNKFNSSKDNIKKYYEMALWAMESISNTNLYLMLKKYYGLVFEN